MIPMHRSAPGMKPGAFSYAPILKNPLLSTIFSISPIAHPSDFCYNYQKMIYNGCVLP